MPGSRPKKAFTRKDYAATEEDFEEAMKKAMVASVESSEVQQATKKERSHVSKGRKADRAALPTPARSTRTRSRSPKLPQQTQARTLPTTSRSPSSGLCDVIADGYDLATAASQKDALESWVRSRLDLSVHVGSPTTGEQKLAALVAEVMLQKAEATGKLMASQVGLAMQQSALRLCATAPPHRHLANMLIACCLRNDSPLEDMNDGTESPQATLGMARFTQCELWELLRYATLNLSVILLSGSKLQGMSLADMPGLHAGCERAFAGIQTSTPELATCEADWTVSKLACWVRCAAVHALGSADEWDAHRRTGGLCNERPECHGPERSDAAIAQNDLLAKPRLKFQDDAEDEDIHGTFRAWQIMRLIFFNTRFLCVSRSRSLPQKSKRLNDFEMNSMLVEACSNMEIILERWHLLGTSVFDKWLEDAWEVQAKQCTLASECC